jgi:1-acyl-sn-glycerol-3-phosphate acyltransferase
MAESASEAPATIDWRTTKRWFTHETWLASLTKFVMGIYYYPKLRIERIGFENIPSGPAIVVANHISNNDPPLMGIAFPRSRYPFFMAKKELFEKYEWYYRTVGAFPVYRGGVDNWAFEHVGKILKAGQLCVLYAEGSRSKKEQVELRRAKTGAVRLADRYKVPILPCSLLGPEKLRNKSLSGWRPVTVRINVGPLIDLQAMIKSLPEELRSSEVRKYRELTNRVMRQLALLLPEENRGYYA